MDIDFSNVTNNLVFLGSFGLAFIGWVVALAGAASTDANIRDGGSLHFTWFVVFYDLFLIFSMLFAVATASEKQYRIVISAFLSIGAVFTCNQINDNIYASLSGNQTIGAGFIFLAIVQFLWIFLFGTEEDSLVKRSVNSVSIVKQQPVAISVNQHAVEQVAITPNAEYAYRARALYEYTANPSDSNELSFAKDEELEIVDNKGKWWQARKGDGTVGIVPSNYVQTI